MVPVKRKDSWSKDGLLELKDFALVEKMALIPLARVCEESLDVKSCVNHVCAFFWDLTLPHCDFLATRTETKMLPESGIWQLHSPWTGIKTREVKE